MIAAPLHYIPSNSYVLCNVTEAYFSKLFACTGTACQSLLSGVCGAATTVYAVSMHPHPGFPVLGRLDDVCGACYETPFAADCGTFNDSPLPFVADEKEGRTMHEALTDRLTGSGWRRLAAIAAVALIATGALCRRRGR